MEPEIRRLRTGFKRTFWLTDAFTAVLIILMTAVIMFRVFNRWFGLGISGQGELAQIMMIWIVFLNIAAAAYKGTDIKSEFLFDQLPKPVQNWATVLILGICLVAALAMFVSAILLIESRWTRVTTSLGWSVAVLYIPLAIGSGLLLLVYASRFVAYLRRIYRRFTNWRAS